MMLLCSKTFWISFVVFSLLGFGLDIIMEWNELGTYFYETPWYIKLTPCYVSFFVSFLVFIFAED